MRPLNRKAARIGNHVASRTDDDVVGLQNPPAPQRPHVPMACSLMFTPGWEVDAAGGTAGLCQPVERDIIRLLCELLLAGASTGPSQQCTGLDQQMRVGYQGLAQSGSGVPVVGI
jgi:hypothetical protein